MTFVPDIIATVDVVILTIRDGKLCVLLTRRENAPFADALALPGGFIRSGEDVDAEDAAYRVLRTKVGAVGLHIEQLQTFSGPLRDPRGYSLTVAYLALVPDSVVPDGAVIRPVDEVSDLAFDHDVILAAAVDRLRKKSSYSSAPAALLEESFTLSDLYAAYRAVMGDVPDPSSFRRKVLAVGAIADTGAVRSGGRGKGRNAALYRLPDGAVRTFDITFKNGTHRA